VPRRSLPASLCHHRPPFAVSISHPLCFLQEAVTSLPSLAGISPFSSSVGFFFSSLFPSLIVVRSLAHLFPSWGTFFLESFCSPPRINWSLRASGERTLKFQYHKIWPFVAFFSRPHGFQRFSSPFLASFFMSPCPGKPDWRLTSRSTPGLVGENRLCLPSASFRHYSPLNLPIFGVILEVLSPRRPLLFGAVFFFLCFLLPGLVFRVTDLFLRSQGPFHQTLSWISWRSVFRFLRCG